MTAIFPKFSDQNTSPLGDWVTNHPGRDGPEGETVEERMKRWDRERVEKAAEPVPNPCPFFSCDDGYLYVEKVWRGQGWQVQCETCKARVPIMFTPAEAVNAWNKVDPMTIEARRSA